jgi:undecaprenyl-diphosphatase
MKRYYILFSLLITLFSFTTIKAQNWDINLLSNINPNNPNSGYWRGATNTTYIVSLGIPATELAVGYLINKDSKTQRNGWETIGSIAFSAAITQGLKYTINRARPYETYPNLIHPYDASEQGKSMPSGHTSTAFASATSLAMQYKKWYVVVPAYAWAAIVGYSRLYLGEHYPSDVFVGAAIGAGSAWLSHWLTRKIWPKPGVSFVPSIINNKNQK